MKTTYDYKKETKRLLKELNHEPFSINLKPLLFTIGMSTALCVFVYYHLLPPIVEKARTEAYSAAFNDFNSNWKSRLSSNTELLNTTCKAWWFTANSSDRKLNIPERKK